VSHHTVVLETTGLMQSFGGVQVIDDLSVQLSEGEGLGIVGPNGADKTTLFNLITGVYRPDVGQVTFKDKDITHLPRQDRCREGIGRTFQISKPFADVRVFENVLVCAAHGLPHRTRAFKLSNDPLFTEKLTDVVGLYLNPPEKALVLCSTRRTSSRRSIAPSRACR